MDVGWCLLITQRNVGCLAIIILTRVGNDDAFITSPRSRNRVILAAHRRINVAKIMTGASVLTEVASDVSTKMGSAIVIPGPNSAVKPW
jgi:hypothetical protein